MTLSLDCPNTSSVKTTPYNGLLVQHYPALNRPHCPAWPPLSTLRQVLPRYYQRRSSRMTWLSKRLVNVAFNNLLQLCNISNLHLISGRFPMWLIFSDGLKPPTSNISDTFVDTLTASCSQKKTSDSFKQVYCKFWSKVNVKSLSGRTSKRTWTSKQHKLSASLRDASGCHVWFIEPPQPPPPSIDNWEINEFVDVVSLYFHSISSYAQNNVTL